MKTLDQICIEHGTDKGTVHPTIIPAHGYAPVYDRHFISHRDAYVKVLEIGVGGGESIRTWLEYFQNGDVYGVDIVANTNDWNTPGKSPDPRYTFFHGDQADETMWKCFVADHGTNWDIIIDDGGHCANQIITAYKAMWQHVVKNGFYCIEDLAVSYHKGSVFCPEGWPNHMKFIADRLDEINLGSDIASLHFTKELAILRKA